MNHTAAKRYVVAHCGYTAPEERRIAEEAITEAFKGVSNWDEKTEKKAIAAARRAVKLARAAAKRRYERTALAVQAAIREEHPGLTRYLAAVGSPTTVDDWTRATGEVIRVAAGRISEAYGLGVGSEWARRHFDAPGDERPALAGHIGRSAAYRLPQVTL
jgi:hypothetical protein